MFLLKRSVNIVGIDLQKIIFKTTLPQLFSENVYAELKSNVLVSVYIMEVNNRNIKVNSAMMSLQNFQWEMSIILPNPSNNKCTFEFISRKKKFASMMALYAFFYILNKTKQNIYNPSEFLLLQLPRYSKVNEGSVLELTHHRCLLACSLYCFIGESLLCKEMQAHLQIA